MSRQFRVAPAARGWRWFQAAIGMLDKNPRGLLLTVLAYVLIGQSPILFTAAPSLVELAKFAAVLLGPALWGGLLYAIGEADAGRAVSVGHLFEAFRRPGAIMPMLVLGVLSVLAAFALEMIAHSMLGPDPYVTTAVVLQWILAQASSQLQGPPPEMLLPLMHFALVASIFLSVLGIGFFFAVPRVLFDRHPPLTAFFESFAASAANVMSLTVYGLAWLGAGFLSMMVLGVVVALLDFLGVLGGLLGLAVSLGMALLVLVVYAAGNYLAWREVFGHAEVAPPAPPTTGIAV